MIQVTDTLDNVQKCTTRLTIDLVNSLLLRNYNKADIGRLCNLHHTTVGRFIKRHYNKIAPVVDQDNTLLIAKSKRIVNQGFDHINTIMQHSEFNKKDMVQLSITTGTIFDKLRLLQGESTQNVGMAVVETNITDQTKANEAQAKANDVLRAKINGLTGEVVDKDL